MCICALYMYLVPLMVRRGIRCWELNLDVLYKSHRCSEVPSRLPSPMVPGFCWQHIVSRIYFQALWIVSVRVRVEQHQACMWLEDSPLCRAASSRFLRLQVSCQSSQSSFRAEVFVTWAVFIQSCRYRYKTGINVADSKSLIYIMTVLLYACIFATY